MCNLNFPSLQAKESTSEESEIDEASPKEPSNAENPSREVEDVNIEDEDGDDEEAFDCNICDFRAMDGEDLNQHIEADHNGKVVQRSENDEEHLQEVAVKFEKEIDFLGDEEKEKTILSLDTAEKMIYPCDECEYKGARSDHLRRHKKKKHGIGNLLARAEEAKLSEVKAAKKSSVFSCDHCSFAATRADNLRRHNRTQHSTNRMKFECNCGVVYLKQENLAGHKLKCRIGGEN